MFKIKLTKDNKDKIPIISKEMIEQAEEAIQKRYVRKDNIILASNEGDIVKIIGDYKCKWGLLSKNLAGLLTNKHQCEELSDVEFLIGKNIETVCDIPNCMLTKLYNQAELKQEFEKISKKIKGENKMKIADIEWQNTSNKVEDEIDEALSKIEKRNDFIDVKEFEEIVNEQLETCKKVLCNKAKEYATEDRLHNFKVAAELESCTPIGALGGMMAKHTVSVYDMINGTNEGAEYSKEMWDEKITDSMNYLLLLKALVAENNKLEEKDNDC